MPAPEFLAPIVRGWRGIPCLVQDLLLTLVAVAVSLGLPLLDLVFGHYPASARWQAPGAVWALLVLAACAPVAVRRKFPFTAAAVSAGIVVLAILLRQPQAGAFVAIGLLGSAAYHSERHRVALAVTGALWALLTVVLLDGGALGVSDVFTAVGTGLGPVAIGYALRMHADHAERLLRLQRARNLQAQAEERTRIAREVHDIVGHHLSAIRLRAVVSRRALGDDPGEAGDALESIAELSGTALGETRGLLDVLREEHPDEQPRGISDLDELVDRLGRSGPKVVLQVEELPPHLEPAMQQCAYRIVQESLTNVVRHADRATNVAVHIGLARRSLEITVRDDGAVRPRTDGRVGTGITGMRERVRLLGGTFTAAPTEPHGWRVHATLPLPEKES